MTSEPRLSLREIVQYSWMDLCLGRGAKATLPVSQGAYERVISDVRRTLKLDEAEAIRLIDECTSIESLICFVERRRAMLLPVEDAHW